MKQQKENDSNRTYRVEDIIKILDIGRTSAYRLRRSLQSSQNRVGNSYFKKVI